VRWSDIPFHPSRKTLRQFGLIWIAFFGGLAAYQWFARGNTTAATILGAAAVTVGPVGLARPEWLRPVFVAWMVLAFPIGWTVSQVMLGAMYYGLFVPVGLAFKLTGRDPLLRSRGPAEGTYWAPKPMPADVRRYLKQF